MPVPTTLSDLSTTIGSNYPTGGETVGTNMDDYLRAHAGLIAQVNANKLETTTAASTYQPLDPLLTSLAGQTTAANKIQAYSGADTASLIDFKDEDDMASNSATAVPSQQSVKAYVDAIGGLGNGQTWQSVTRTSGTTYTNSTGKPIMVRVNYKTTVDGSSVTCTLTIGGNAAGSSIIYAQTASTYYGTDTFVVPAGSTYVMTITTSSGTPSILSCYELR